MNNKQLQNLNVGDIIVDEFGKYCKVLAVLQRNSELTLYVLSSCNSDIESDYLKRYSSSLTAFELDELDFTLHTPEKENKRWMPDEHEDYWCVDNSGSVIKDCWTEHGIDEFRLQTGNVHKTKKEAIAYREKLIKLGKE